MPSLKDIRCQVKKKRTEITLESTQALNQIYGPLYLDNSFYSVFRESDQGEPVEILPYLYLGSGYHASCKRNLEKLGITALLNVSQNCPNHFEDTFIYKCIPVKDSGSEEISLWFDEAIDFIDSIKQSNGKVLVHCRAGISRSATICMAYLMATKKLRMEESYEFVKSRRRIVSPNFNFMGQLLGFEAKLFNTTATANGFRTGGSKKVMDPPRSPLIAFPANNSLNNSSHCSFNNCLSSSSPSPTSSSLSSSSSSSCGHLHHGSHLLHHHHNHHHHHSHHNNVNNIVNSNIDNPPVTPLAAFRTPDSTSSSSSSLISASSCSSKVSSSSSSSSSSPTSSSSSLPDVMETIGSSSSSSSSVSSSVSSSSFSSFSSPPFETSIRQPLSDQSQDEHPQQSRSIFEFNQVPSNYLPAPTDLSSSSCSLFQSNSLTSSSESTYESFKMKATNTNNNNKNSTKLMTLT